MNKKDLILKAMISEKTVNPSFSYASLRDSLFSELNIDQVKFLIESIDKEKPELLIIMPYSEKSPLIQPTGLVNEFLNQGGFTKIEKDKELLLNKQNEREEREIRKSKVDLELAEKMLKEFPTTKVFSRIGAFIGIALLLKELYILIWKPQ
ncbi:hypothetical protein BTO15_00180 [Polaribacter sejongensis]|uniref:Uncharacterized protein n=1 Tax=Polaribacter sejongensis TaxID=985043 RepID=A0ABM6PVF9_9FLAO|nr:hypothetical protein [Polaribacter sejongensis]AUC20626.1 hypothetical protein BTO15_00180 [Polaribacter sejongensis]